MTRSLVSEPWAIRLSTLLMFPERLIMKSDNVEYVNVESHERHPPEVSQSTGIPKSVVPQTPIQRFSRRREEARLAFSSLSAWQKRERIGKAWMKAEVAYCQLVTELDFLGLSEKHKRCLEKLKRALEGITFEQMRDLMDQKAAEHEAQIQARRASRKAEKHDVCFPGFEVGRK
jgi:hypothetical protein